MQYLKSGPFSVKMAGDEEYRQRYDAIDWGNKDNVEDPDFVDFDEDEANFLTWDDIPCATIQNQVRAFHEIYGQPILDKPTVPSAERIDLRLKLIAEEFVELLTAAGVNTAILEDQIAFALARRVKGFDLVEVADALGDLAYVIEGSNLEFGVDSARVLAEIHRSNLSKLGEDGKPIYSETGKILKGPHYTHPDIASALK